MLSWWNMGWKSKQIEGNTTVEIIWRNKHYRCFSNHGCHSYILGSTIQTGAEFPRRRPSDFLGPRWLIGILISWLVKQSLYNCRYQPSCPYINSKYSQGVFWSLIQNHRMPYIRQRPRVFHEHCSSWRESGTVFSGETSEKRRRRRSVPVDFLERFLQTEVSERFWGEFNVCIYIYNDSTYMYIWYLYIYMYIL